ncbi:HU family DNA-binding protein [Myxococcota bacterium]
MTKAELIERVAKHAGPTVSKKMVTKMVESVFEHLHKAIRKDKRFTYPGFGTFSVKKRKARKGRNPKTGEVIMIAPTRTVAFKPAPNLKASLN